MSLQTPHNPLTGDLARELVRSLEESLETFRGDLEAFLRPLVEAPIPSDWRGQLASFVAVQAQKGYLIAPHSREALAEWIERQSLLDGHQASQSQDAWRVDATSSSSADAISVVPSASAMQLAAFVAPGKGNGAARPPGAPPAGKPSRFNEQGLEIAGPGPETTASFQLKVQTALQVLDPRVAKWWRANSVRGQVRSRAARFWQWNYYSRMDSNSRPEIVVDQNYTAGQTAQAIIAEVSDGWFADSVGVFYKSHEFGRTQDIEQFRAWQKGSAQEAARLASVLAELYLNGIATITPSGDLVVTLGDVAENGPRWQQFWSILPYLGHMAIVGVALQLGQRRLRIKKKTASRFAGLSLQERTAILVAVDAAPSDQEAARIFTEQVIAVAGERQIHHPISAAVHEALQNHAVLRDTYQLRDTRFELLAVTKEAHIGYERWHIELDNEVVAWLAQNSNATRQSFEKWLKSRYNKPDLRWRFSNQLE